MKTRTVQLGDVCEFHYGDSLKEDRRQPGHVPVFGSNGIVGWHNEANTSGPTIVIGRKGSIGEINWSDVPCFPIDTTYFVDKTKLPCDMKWLFHALVKLDLTRLNKSAAVPGLNRDDAYEQLLLFPPLSEQQRIAGVLEQADRLRRTRRYALELSDSFLPAAFRQLFGDPVINPHCFKVRPLAEQIVLLGGYAFQSSDFVNAGIPLIRIGNANKGDIVLSDITFLPQEMAHSLERFLIYPGDMLMTLTGTVGKDDYGNLCIVSNAYPRWFLNQRVAKVRFINDELLPSFLFHVLKSPRLKALLLKADRGVRQANLSNDDVYELNVIVPPRALQQQFVSLVSRHERLRAVQRESLRQAEHLFQSLLHRAFTTGL
ncbi:MAG: restriction endonuclease subunit S [Planctomycetaceae bacterium]